MISVNLAKKILSEQCMRAEITTIDLKGLCGLVLAQSIHSPMNVPSFDNSAMDGYALNLEGGAHTWKILYSIQAGDTSEFSIESGNAARIFTGAKIPKGADTVIPQELVETEKDQSILLYKGNRVKVGNNIRLSGSQCKVGDLILEEGTPLNPGSVGLLASVGVKKARVYTPPSVAYIITGNELKEVGAPLTEGEIYNSNGPMLEASLRQTGITKISAYKAGDDREILQKTIDQALCGSDVLLLSGGISVGDYDYVKECLENSGVKQLFHKLRQRPGKPFFAGKKGDKMIFALPGNPASVLSCYLQYIKPCLRFMMGHNNVWKPDTILPLMEDTRKKPGLSFFVKAVKTGEKVKILDGQQSFNLSAFGKADCFVELEEESEIIKAGTLVNTYYL